MSGDRPHGRLSDEAVGAAFRRLRRKEPSLATLVKERAAR